MNKIDCGYAWRHAFAYADRLVTTELAMGYANHYIEVCDDAGVCLDHPHVYPQWVDTLRNGCVPICIDACNPDEARDRFESEVEPTRPCVHAFVELDGGTKGRNRYWFTAAVDSPASILATMLDDAREFRAA